VLSSVGPFTRLSTGALQAFGKGDGARVFQQLIRGATRQSNGLYRLPDGTLIGRHLSKTTGKVTIDINQGGVVYKVRY
jgi:hypothetical protein